MHSRSRFLHRNNILNPELDALQASSLEQGVRVSKRGHKISSGTEEKVGFLKGNITPLLPEKTDC
jgi:hypothetical protein